MIYAIIENNTVSNIAESTYALDHNWVIVPFGAHVSIGDSYRNNMFYDSDGNVKFTPEAMEIKSKVDESFAQIADLKTAFDALMGGVSVALGL